MKKKSRLKWCYNLSMLYQKFGKRTFDLLLSSLALVFLWPVFLLIAILIKIDSEGPIIFKQKRVGKNGKIFTLYKFRTMVKNAQELKKKYQKFNEANGPVFKIKDDPRLTNFGKKQVRSGLDELPQLINVLKGEMSLVGPRPLPIEEAIKIKKKYRKTRESVKPGLVSSWVACGTNHSSFQRWMELDMRDIKNSSLFWDSKVILESLKILLGFLV